MSTMYSVAPRSFAIPSIRRSDIRSMSRPKASQRRRHDVEPCGGAPCGEDLDDGLVEQLGVFGPTGACCRAGSGPGPR